MWPWRFRAQENASRTNCIERTLTTENMYDSASLSPIAPDDIATQETQLPSVAMAVLPLEFLSFFDDNFAEP